MKVLGLLVLTILTSIAAAAAGTAATYGTRGAIASGDLIYPNFAVRLVHREIPRRTGTALVAVNYTLAVIDPDRRVLTQLKFTQAGAFDNVRFFAVAGKKYAAEMFYTTTDQSPHPQWSPTPDGHLRPGELVVWDEPSAQANNPKLARAFAN